MHDAAEAITASDVKEVSGRGPTTLDSTDALLMQPEFVTECLDAPEPLSLNSTVCSDLTRHRLNSALRTLTGLHLRGLCAVCQKLYGSARKGQWRGKHGSDLKLETGVL